MMWVRIATPSGAVNVINTHLGLTRADRERQTNELLGPECLSAISDEEPVILCGDLNAGPRSDVVRRLSQRLRCVQSMAENHRPVGTFASVMPVRQIDYVMVSRHFAVDCVHVPRTPTACLASDHLPVCATLRVAAVLSDQTEGSSRADPAECLRGGT